MNLKKYIIAVLVVYVLYSGLAFVTHEVILRADYTPLEGTVTRAMAEFGLRVPLLYLGNLIFALAFCALYAEGYNPAKNRLSQGLRYGLLLGTLLAPFAITEYVVYPVPAWLALKWILFGYFQVLVSAVAAAAVYTPPPVVKKL